jgi:hypothetical protein
MMFAQDRMRYEQVRRYPAAPLEAWLDARHGSGSFARMFRAPAFAAEPEVVR